MKLYGSYMAPFGTQFGANFYGGSGTPLTTYVDTANQTNVFVDGRGDMGRTDMLTRTDFLVSHELKLGDGNKRLRLELNLLNAFNQKTSRHQFNYLNRGAGAPRASSAINLGDVDLRNGYDYNARSRDRRTAPTPTIRASTWTTSSSRARRATSRFVSSSECRRFGRRSRIVRLHDKAGCPRASAGTAGVSMFDS